MKTKTKSMRIIGLLVFLILLISLTTIFGVYEGMSTLSPLLSSTIMPIKESTPLSEPFFPRARIAARNSLFF